MIFLAADSTAYLTRQEAKELGVVHIPMTYSIDGEAFYETFHKEDERFRDVQRKAKTGYVRTSQPSMGAILRRFQRLTSQGGEALCLTLSSRLSGTYENAVECAKRFSGNVRVVDTRLTAAGMYIMTQCARRMIDAGASLSEIESGMLELREHIKMLFSVADLTPLRRSGRLGLVRQSVGTILNQRPILGCLDGAVVCMDTARGRGDQLRKLAEAVPEDALCVTAQYCSDKENAAALCERLSNRLGRDIAARSIGVVLGVHLGFDVIGVTWLDPAAKSIFQG